MIQPFSTQDPYLNPPSDIVGVPFFSLKMTLISANIVYTVTLYALWDFAIATSIPRIDLCPPVIQTTDISQDQRIGLRLLFQKFVRIFYSAFPIQCAHYSFTFAYYSQGFANYSFKKTFTCRHKIITHHDHCTVTSQDSIKSFRLPY